MSDLNSADNNHIVFVPQNTSPDEIYDHLISLGWRTPFYIVAETYGLNYIVPMPKNIGKKDHFGDKSDKFFCGKRGTLIRPNSTTWNLVLSEYEKRFTKEITKIIRRKQENLTENDLAKIAEIFVGSSRTDSRSDVQR